MFFKADTLASLKIKLYTEQDFEVFLKGKKRTTDHIDLIFKIKPKQKELHSVQLLHRRKNLTWALFGEGSLVCCYY